MKVTLLTFLLLSGLAASGQPASVPQQPRPTESNVLSPAATANTNSHLYRVKSGDTDVIIARKFGMTRKALQAANPDIPMAKLKVGQALVIPVEHWAETNAAPKAVSKASYQSKPLPATTPYVVSRGDTAKKIAKKHGISVSALLTANPGLDPARMKVGQMLAIPQKPGRPSAVLKNGQKH